MTAVSVDEQPAEVVSARPVVDLVKLGPYWRWAAAATLLRLPSLMSPLALVLISLHYTGSPALGGLLVSVSLVPTMVAAPIAGRVLDRIGPATWTPRLMVFGGVVRALVAVGFVRHFPAAVLVAVTLIGALATCGVGGATRALLQTAVPKHLIGTALSLDSVSTEIVVISAPFLVVLTAIPGAFYPMLTVSAASLACALLLRNVGTVARAATEEPAKQPSVGRAKWSLLRSREFVFWVLVTMAFGQVMGTADLSVLPISVAHGGGTTQAAVLSAVLGAVSAATGLAYAWFGKRLRLGLVGQACTLLVLMTASIAFIASSHGWVPLIAAFAVLGMWSAPLNTVTSEAPGHIIPPKRRAEGFNILASAGVLGFAAAGGLLSVLPFHRMLVLGPTMAVVALCAAPLLLGSRRSPAAAEAG